MERPSGQSELEEKQKLNPVKPPVAIAGKKPKNIIFILAIVVLIGLSIVLDPSANRFLHITIVPLLREPSPIDVYNKSLGEREVFVGGLAEKNGILELAIARLKWPFQDAPQAQMELVQRITKTFVKDNVGAIPRVTKILYRIYDSPQKGDFWWIVDTRTFVVSKSRGDPDMPAR